MNLTNKILITITCLIILLLTSFNNTAYADIQDSLTSEQLKQIESQKYYDINKPFVLYLTALQEKIIYFSGDSISIDNNIISLNNYTSYNINKSNNSVEFPSYSPAPDRTSKYIMSFPITNLEGRTFLQSSVNIKDSSGNLIFAETIKPTLNVSNTSIPKGSKFNPLNGSSAHDNVDGDITSKIVTEGNIDTSIPGTYPITYKVTDNAGNTTKKLAYVTVDNTDTNKPTINAQNKIIIKGSTFNLLDGITATDDLDGDITSKIQVIGTVDTNKPGNYPITYKVSDAAGNETIIDIIITVVIPDINKPTINAKNRTIQQGVPFNPQYGVTAFDDTDGDLTNYISVSGNVDINTIGTYKLTYTVQDSSKNIATLDVYITVEKPFELNNDSIMKMFNIGLTFLGITSITTIALLTALLINFTIIRRKI